MLRSISTISAVPRSIEEITPQPNSASVSPSNIIQRWYGKEHPKAATSLVMLGVAIDSQGRIHEAEKLYQQGLAIHERVYGGVHMRIGQVVNYLGMNALKQAKLDEAEAHFRGR